MWVIAGPESHSKLQVLANLTCLFVCWIFSFGLLKLNIKVRQDRPGLFDQHLILDWTKIGYLELKKIPLHIFCVFQKNQNLKLGQIFKTSYWRSVKSRVHNFFQYICNFFSSCSPNWQVAQEKFESKWLYCSTNSQQKPFSPKGNWSGLPALHKLN